MGPMSWTDTSRVMSLIADKGSLKRSDKHRLYQGRVGNEAFSDFVKQIFVLQALVRL